MTLLTSPIYFPGLGIELDPSNVAFTIGGHSFYWYGIIIAVGFLLAVGYGMKRADQFGLTQDNIIDLLIFAVPAAIIGARAYYCVFNWAEYADDPISVLYIWNGGLAIYGAIIAAAITVVIFARVKKIRPGAILDIGSLGMLIGQMVGRWGNFINREAHGAECTNFLRMGLMDSAGKWVYYHPTFLYESLWNLLGFVLLHLFSKKHRKFDGQLFLMYMCWYGFGRGMIEGLRTDSLYFFGTGLRISQFLGYAFFVVCLVILFVQLVFRDHDPADMQVWIFSHSPQAATAGEAPAAPLSEEATVTEDTEEATVTEETGTPEEGE